MTYQSGYYVVISMPRNFYEKFGKWNGDMYYSGHGSSQFDKFFGNQN